MSPYACLNPANSRLLSSNLIVLDVMIVLD